jgi:hypothetical protein
VNDKPPPFEDYISVSEDELWAKILSGEIKAHIYSSEAPGDLEPVPISAAAFFVAEEAGRKYDDGEPDPQLKPYQIMFRDRDRRRPSATKRGIPAAHWVYVMKTDLKAPTQPVAQDLPSAAPKAIRARTSPEQERALKAILAIYGKIPPQGEVSNPVLEQAVNKHLKQEGLEAVKKDTIQRATGRRR